MAFSKEKAHERAERYAAKGQHDKAAREYQSIVDADPKDIRAWLMLADCLARSGDPGNAIARYMQVADYYASQKAHQKALAVYRQVLNLDGTRFDVLLKCANLNMEVGRVHDAIAAYEQIAQAQLHAGNTTEAIRTFQLIADADPSVVSKRLRLAELFSREGMVDQAVAAFRTAADVLLQTNRRPDYVRVAERLLYHRNDDRPTIRKLARVYLDLGDPRRALMKLNALLKADRHDQQGLELLADTFMALGKPDKASSVLAELVRDLAKTGDAGQNEALRVLDKGLQWSPNEPSLVRLRSELAPAVTQAPAAAQESEPMELDDDEIVEIDDDDLVIDEGSNANEPAPTLEPVRHGGAGHPRGNGVSAPAGGMTASVVREAQAPAPGGEGATDLDKILFEARVYVKYRLFDHALDHIDELLSSQPKHVGALSLRARALGELGRFADAADAHVTVARMVSDRDPKLAQEHLDAALEAVPGHGAATSLRSALTASQPPSSTPTAPPPPPGDEIDLDAPDEEDFAIEIADDAHDREPEPTYEVENRFGVSESGPLPARDSGPVTEGTPPSGFVPMPPPEPAAARRHRVDPSALQRPVPGRDTGRPVEVIDQPTEQFAPAPNDLSFAASVDEEGAPPTTFDLPFISSDETEAPEDDYPDFDSDPEDFAGVNLADRSGEYPQPTARTDSDPSIRAPSPDDIYDDATDAVDLELDRPAPEPPAEPAPEPAKSWPDISEDLAEIRFFMDQGLDEDAEAALRDLKVKHGGHPELARIEAELSGVAEPVQSFQSGAQPLVDLTTEEDEDEDAYLSAIFGEAKPAEPRPKKKRVGVKARADDVEGANARDQFDLGMAYREMGLVDEAITQFEMASSDPSWRSRALVMMGALRVHRGETDQAVRDLTEAIESANTEDERCEAQYELAVLYERVGDTGAAIEHLQSVAVGYRDRDERLVALQG